MATPSSSPSERPTSTEYLLLDVVENIVKNFGSKVSERWSCGVLGSVEGLRRVAQEGIRPSPKVSFLGRAFGLRTCSDVPEDGLGRYVHSPLPKPNLRD